MPLNPNSTGSPTSKDVADWVAAHAGGGGGSVGNVTLTDATAANQIPVTTDATHGAWVAAATRSTSTPSGDTSGGAAGNSGTYADGAHQHDLSTAYDRFGARSLNVVAASGATQTIPAPTSYQTSWVKLTADCTLTFPTATAGLWFELYLQQDTTGSRAVTMPNNIGWVSGVQPTLSTTTGLVDKLSFMCVDGTNWVGVADAIGVSVPPVPLSFIQTATVTGFNQGTLTFPGNVTAGSSILLVICGQSSVVPGAPSGGGVTWAQVGALSTPAAPTVTPQGATGATTYKYAITYVNALGQTVASAVTTITNGNATLNGSNFNRISWPAAPADAASVKVYGRSGTPTFMATVNVGTTQYDDTGAATPSGASPSSNTTGVLPAVGSGTVSTVVYLGTNSSGGGGTSTISFAQNEAVAWAAEIQNAVVESSGTPKTKSGTIGNWPGAETESSPTLTAPRAGDVPVHVFTGGTGYNATGPGGSWTAVQLPTGGNTKNEAIVLYQANTLNGNSYGANVTTTRVDGNAGQTYGFLSFFLKAGP